ncbi:O-antigen polysaccharide polymerase Wzy [Spirulina sp. CS-785/01]|uniref:O-antigen polysaccharide polymerase Wzy n=1 Tax=Spirulina sp. CS-785/01 TaxID=3021716 RepID=UPI00232FE5D3|nr:O-antigen polysaccharide polymerase Wzy [Spirulina sp. CS-785/01]MDB9313247.1 O-antigen polysaccharide polymerase Wzy [Spirulina sp. CS-785/01]
MTSVVQFYPLILHTINGVFAQIKAPSDIPTDLLQFIKTLEESNTLWTAEEEFFLIQLFIALLLVFSIIYVSFRDWRQSVKLVFFVLVIDGALRKWLLPQASEFIYFLKDLILLGAYFRYYIFPRGEDRYPIQNNFINIFIIISAGWCIFQAFNPNLGSPLVGLLGLKSYLFYIPLIWMMPRLFRSQQELYIFLRNHLFLLIPVGILGIVQFFSPINSPINQYIPGRNEPIATFGFAGTRNVRITGTFSYLNSYQGYLAACFGLLIPQLSIKQDQIWRILTYTEIFLTILNSFMTGSRTPVIAEILFILGYFSIRALRQPEKTFLWLGRLLPFLAVAASLSLIAFRPVVEAFWVRVSSNTDLAERIASGFIGPFSFLTYTGLDGFGAGATHAGAGSLRLALGLPWGTPLPVEVEPEMGRVALELGPIGFILWYGMRVAIIFALWRTFTRLKRLYLRDLALAGFLIHGILFINQMVYHNSFGWYYWFYTGLVFLLPQLERIENWREEQYYLQQYNTQYRTDSPYR